MVRLEVCSKGVSPLVIFESDTLDHDRYSKEVLPVALKYGNGMLGDGAKPHIHEKSQKWCAKNFPSFIDNDHWPPNSPDLNPLDYCVCNQIAQVTKWHALKSKKTLIMALKRPIIKIFQRCCL